MAKGGGIKKASATAKKPAKKVAERVKSAAKAVKKVAAKAVAGSKKKPAKPAAKPVKAVKPAARPAKKAVKPVRPAAKPPAKPVKKAVPAKAAKLVPKAIKGAKKVVAKAAKPLKAVAKPVAKAMAKAAPAAKAKVAAAKAAAPKAIAPKAAPLKAVPPPKPAKTAAKAAPAPAPVAAAPAPAPRPVAAAPAADDKKRTRRPRPRILSNGTPVAAWLTPGEKPRPSSFIPAPARAEAPSLVAAPPASSDRLIRPEDVSELAVRTVPVRIDIEQGGGRTFLGVSPEEVTLKPGEGIEWDFRYVGGADVMADEIVIEFEKPAPFAQHIFKSRKPGTARPHRQLSGPADPAAAGKRIRYVVRAMTPFKTEFAVSRPWVTVQE
jgi:hypothetical protein